MLERVRTPGERVCVHARECANMRERGRTWGRVCVRDSSIYPLHYSSGLKTLYLTVSLGGTIILAFPWKLFGSEI